MLSDLIVLVCTVMCGAAVAFGLFYAMANLHGAAFVFAIVLFAIALVAAIDAALEIVSIVVPDMVRTIKARFRRHRNGK